MNYVLDAIDFATGFLVLWVVGTFGYYWATETGSFWERTLKAGRDSATIVWSRVVMAISGVVALLVQAADAAGDPQVGALIQKYLRPDVVGYVMIATMFITVMARKRSL